jgi:hypothetical protein
VAARIRRSTLASRGRPRGPAVADTPVEVAGDEPMVSVAISPVALPAAIAPLL